MAHAPEYRLLFASLKDPQTIQGEARFQSMDLSLAVNDSGSLRAVLPLESGGKSYTFDPFSWSDDFERGDSTSTPGAHYDVTSGTWGIDSGDLDVVSVSTRTTCTVEVTDSSDYEMVAVIGSAASMNSQAVVAAMVDASNYMTVIAVPGFATWNVYSQVSGGFTYLGNVGVQGSAAGTYVRLTKSGTDLDVDFSSDGETWTTPTSWTIPASLEDGKRVGFQTDTVPSGGPWASLEVTSAASASTITTPADYLQTQLQPASTVLWVERGGSLLWGGIVWASSADPVAGSMTLAAEGWHSYWRRRVDGARSYTSTDVFTIVRDIVDDAQAVAHGDIGIDTSDTNLAGVTKTLDWPADLTTVAERLESLASDGASGFQWRYDHAWSSGSPTAYFRLTYPARGTRTDHILELGTNVLSMSLQLDGSAIATESFLSWQPPSNAGSPTVTLSSATTASLSSYPILETVVTGVDAATLTTQAVAQGELDNLQGLRGAIVKRASVVIRGDDPGLGDFEVGDSVTLRATKGWLSISERFTILSIRVSVGDGETVGLELVNEGALYA